jgi:hypothetical protein
MSRRTIEITGLLIAAIIVGLLSYDAVPGNPHPAAAHPLAQEGESLCVPVSVAVFNNRIHVECMNATFRYFAAPLEEPTTEEFLTTLSTAMSSIPIMELRIGYIDDQVSGPAFGCNVGDCRKISYVMLLLKPGAPLN